MPTTTPPRWLEQRSWPLGIVALLALIVSTLTGLICAHAALLRTPASIGIGGLIMFAGSFLVLRALGTLRVALDQTTLHIRLGVFHERIPLEHITGCLAVPYRWQTWGGFGRHRRQREWLYNVPKGRDVVVLQLANGRRVLFSSQTPRRTCAAIQQAVTRRRQEQ